MVSGFERRPLTLSDDTSSVWRSWIVLNTAAFKTRHIFGHFLRIQYSCTLSGSDRLRGTG